MPPRTEVFTALQRCSKTSKSASIISKVALAFASTRPQRRQSHDPYREAQQRARQAAFESRKKVLHVERTQALGDPVKGVETPFLRSLDKVEPLPGERTTKRLKFFLDQDELDESIARSQVLTEHIPDPGEDRLTQEARDAQHKEQHANAREALNRIASLAQASGFDRLKANTARIIDTFGRHSTDQYLKRKPSLSAGIIELRTHEARPEKTPRAGPDTGSSEVQIAILTTKIRGLKQFLDARGNTDRINKKNLRLLVHRRQRLLEYLRRKERGGERWQNCIEKLGLTEGTWRGEISI